MKKYCWIFALVLAFSVLFTGCTRNYTHWSLIYSDSIGSEIAQTTVDREKALFYVPDGWVCSRVDDFVFFANYEVTDLNNIFKSDGTLYALGWINYSDDIAPHTIGELFGYAAMPSDPIVFSVGLDNGAYYGMEKYDIGGTVEKRHYISLQSEEIFEIKLIDWQGVCGKKLMRDIAASYSTPHPRAS